MPKKRLTTGKQSALGFTATKKSKVVATESDETYRRMGLDLIRCELERLKRMMPRRVWLVVLQQAAEEIEGILKREDL